MTKPNSLAACAQYTMTKALSVQNAAINIHLDLLQVIEINLAGAQIDLESNHLHDLRVAVRRTRTILGLIRNVFSTSQLTKFKREFAWVQQVTSFTRDLQVHRQALQDYQASLPLDIRKDLAPLDTFLSNQQVIAQAKMTQAFNSSRFKALLQDWRTILETSRPITKSIRTANDPIQAVVGERLRRLHLRILKEGRLLTETSAAESFHDLRKRCKKLRYLLEFFQVFYAPAPTQQVLKRVKELLNTLGIYQDLDIQAHTLQAAHLCMVADGIDKHTQYAIDHLVLFIQHRQVEIKKQFFQVFAVFDSIEERDLFKAMRCSGM